MNATVQKWGNSLALRIPRALAKDVRLRQGSVVEMAVVEGKVVVRPKRMKKYALAQLLKAVTAENRHAEAEWSSPAGREVW